MFVFEGINVYLKDWLTFSGGIDRPGELLQLFCLKWPYSGGYFPTHTPDYEFNSPALLDFFLGASICSTMAFPPFGNSDHVVVSVSIDFPLNSKRDAPFHRIACDYSCAD